MNRIKKNINKIKPTILIVDDEPSFYHDMRAAFDDEFNFMPAVSENEMWSKLETASDKIQLIILDLRLEKGNDQNIGLNLIAPLKSRYSHIPVIVGTVEEDGKVAVNAMNLGAKNFLFKSDYNRQLWFDRFQDAIQAQQAPILEKKVDELESKVDQLEEEVKTEKEEKYKFIGISEQVKEIKETLKMVANESDITVLLTGETGTGKEVAAQYLYRHSSRFGKPFVAVSLTDITPSLIESHLFGYKKGAFTGADRDSDGLFMQADNGILFLDEIGEISLEIQGKLLRVLDSRSFTPMGGNNIKPIKVDVQVIAATSKNLNEEVAQKRFKQDLYERLNVMKIEIPPLRKRREDIPVLLEYFLQQKHPGIDPLQIFHQDALEQILSYDWPGNVRGLKNAVDYMLLRKKIKSKDHIDVECLPADLKEQVVESGSQLPEGNKKSRTAYHDLLKIESALRKYLGNKTQVATDLGYPGTDNLLSRIKTIYKNHKDWFEQFPTIKNLYKLK